MNNTSPPIYKLYEANIGLLVPMIAEVLDRDAKEYPYSWIECAVALAVKNEARSWRYVEAVLKRWKVDGFDGRVRKADRSPRRDTVEARMKYGEWEG